MIPPELMKHLQQIILLKTHLGQIGQYRRATTIVVNVFTMLSKVFIIHLLDWLGSGLARAHEAPPTDGAPLRPYKKISAGCPVQKGDYNTF